MLVSLTVLSLAFDSLHREPSLDIYSMSKRRAELAIAPAPASPKTTSPSNGRRAKLEPWQGYYAHRVPHESPKRFAAKRGALRAQAADRGAPRAPAPRAWETPSLASVAEAKAERDAPTSRHELVRAWVNSQFQGRVAHSRARPAKQKVAPATAMSGR